MFRSCGAGVLPFRVTRHGTVVFLLAKEQHSQGWHGSGKLSAFEGGRERCESPTENAIREFTEESMAILYCGDRHAREASQLLTQEHTCQEQERDEESVALLTKIIPALELLYGTKHKYVKRANENIMNLIKAS